VSLGFEAHLKAKNTHCQLLDDCVHTLVRVSLECKHRCVALKWRVGGGGKISHQDQSPQRRDETPKNEGMKLATYVERTETSAVRVKCLIVEIGELLSDSVDVCHGFFSWWE
jgi:hypothetical protein